jgi:hypothetical protein
MKTFSLLFFAMIFIVACKKDHNSNSQNPTTPPVVLPTAPDTLGAGWTKVGSIPIEENVTDVFFADLNNGYATTNSGVYKSSNSGTDWVKINSDYDFINIAAKGSKACFFNKTSNIYRTTDYGATVQTINYTYGNPGSPGFNDGFYTSDNTCYACSYLYIWKSTNGGANFDTIHGFNDANHQDVTLFFSDDLHGWVTRNYHLFKTTDGGVSWVDNKTLGNYYGSISFTDANNGYVADGSNLYKTTDAGASWQHVDDYFTNDTIMDIHFFTPLYGYCTAGNRIYKTTDGGSTWSVQVALGDKYVVEVFFLDEHHGWACGQYGYILRFNL